MRTRRFAVVVCLFFATFLCSQGQMRILPKEKVDSIANPPLAPDAETVDFDRIVVADVTMSTDDEPRTFEYGFVNKGDEPVIISRLVSTCSCAQASYDKRVIAPGERGVIRLRYNPEGRVGKNVRRVLVYTGTNTQPTAVLRLEVTH